MILKIKNEMLFDVAKYQESAYKVWKNANEKTESKVGNLLQKY